MKNIYLDRYAWPGPIIKKKPKKDTKIIVVIPCYHEPAILDTLTSLYNCESPNCQVEIIIVINHSNKDNQKIKDFNFESANTIEKWICKNNHSSISAFIIKAFDLPNKHSGVGLARKIGMDEAVRRFDFLNDKKGIIVCFDADCLCSKNYLTEIFNTYTLHQEVNTALVYFEHPLKGILSKDIYDGITDYELHLRYYKNALKITGFPFSFHTIGSCITVPSEAYQKQGGMNKRKAGEDFYFLQKIFPHGGIKNINKAMVIPSPRPSDRVPFGTGRAINDLINSDSKNYLTYSMKTFIDLKYFMDSISHFYHESDLESVLANLPISIQEFLDNIDFQKNLSNIKGNCISEIQFYKSFFQWFNGFAVLKYVHFARDNYYKNIEILEGANWIINELKLSSTFTKDKKKALMLLRQLDKSD